MYHSSFARLFIEQEREEWDRMVQKEARKKRPVPGGLRDQAKETQEVNLESTRDVKGPDSQFPGGKADDIEDPVREGTAWPQLTSLRRDSQAVWW
ncbi:hypothetical protein FRB96_008341 [Tulasnella sp. 330]|nr:hypothetical protein FRB96_008341 [Tulasnella sp. 330]